MNEQQEAALVSRCKAGDIEAFRALIELHRGVLFGTAYLMTRDRGLAEDAVQEALIKIWRNLPSLRLQGSVKAWMVRIVVNEIRQQFRKKKLPMTPLEEAPEALSEHDEAETMLIRGEERQSLRQALNKLTAEQREAIVLRYFSNLSVPEIAAAVNKPEGTIKSRLSRALEHLNTVLMGDGVWEGRK